MSECSHFTLIRKLRWGMVLASLMVGCALARVAAAEVPEQNLEQDGAGTAATEPKSVNVITRRDGQDTHFFVENKEYGEVTMTFEMGLVNLEGDVEFPFTLTFPPRQTVEAFTLSPINPSAKWSFDYTNYYKLGSNIARHDDSYTYELPYQPGTHHRVTQGYNGKFSHTGSNQYAIDWQMPEGTLVCAARGGIVVRVKDDSDRGGSSMAFDRFNNYVLIRHSDGTMGHYCHLQKDGVLVKVGETVFAGQPIAHSGTTGFSSGPHLHFCVFKTKNGRERVSLPTRFRTAEDEAITLVSGRTYRAVGVETASAPVSSGAATARGAAGQ